MHRATKWFLHLVCIQRAATGGKGIYFLHHENAKICAKMHLAATWKPIKPLLCSSTNHSGQYHGVALDNKFQTIWQFFRSHFLNMLDQFYDTFWSEISETLASFFTQFQKCLQNTELISIAANN